jgi:hypothetical protein
LNALEVGWAGARREATGFAAACGHEPPRYGNGFASLSLGVNQARKACQLGAWARGERRQNPWESAAFSGIERWHVSRLRRHWHP